MNIKSCFNILLLCTFTLGCSNRDSPRSEKKLPEDTIEASESVAVENADELLSDTAAVSSDEPKIDTVANSKQAITAGEKGKYIPPDFPKPYKTSLTLPELEAVDIKNHNTLDSLNTLAQECLNKERGRMYWVIRPYQSKMVELAMVSSIGKDYKGYFLIDDMLFLTTKDLPQLFRPTGKNKEFVFRGIDMPITEHYPVILLSKENDVLKIVDTYFFPCN